MITILIYTSKTYNTTSTFMERGDLRTAPSAKTAHKGGGWFKFAGTKEEFIKKVVAEDVPESGIFGYAPNPKYASSYSYLNASSLHTADMENSFISGNRLKNEFVEFLKTKYGIGKTYIANGDNGAGIFIIEDNDYEVLDF